MKKIMILAAMLGMFAACGGPKAKDAKGAQEMTVVEKYHYYQESIQKAIDGGKYENAEKLATEFQEWAENLSEKESEELYLALYGEDAG